MAPRGTVPIGQIPERRAWAFVQIQDVCLHRMGPITRTVTAGTSPGYAPGVAFADLPRL
jgi:hypothetical protein